MISWSIDSNSERIKLICLNHISYPYFPSLLFLAIFIWKNFITFSLILWLPSRVFKIWKSRLYPWFYCCFSTLIWFYDFVFAFVFCFIETWFHFVDWITLCLKILMPQLLKGWSTGVGHQVRLLSYFNQCIVTMN